MAPPAVVVGLVERFEEQREDYRRGRYNEAQLRQDFLNPFFKALGWDVYNEKDRSEAYREVIHEAAIKVGGRMKAPDYCFRAGGGKASFFVEAKKPSMDIREAVSPAYQLRRYAWSAKLPVSILTDFEEFAVYDCRRRPVKSDKASTGRVIYHNYSEYAECWDELAGLFSPEAILRGALERFVASKRVKKGTAEVDAAFLEEIESWREVLARNIALRNKGLSRRELNFAVQRTVDRIIFLRICEDRGIERYGTLQALQNGPKVYRRLAQLFQQADDRYNSGLFYFTEEKGRGAPDELTLGLTVDDKPLKEILKNLYYPDSPYEFSVLPAEILGQVYEQFLGKVIRLTKGHQAKVEEKPEVKKAGGVYYTPKYIVDYIVEHTVGKLVEGRGTRGEGRGGKSGRRKSARGAKAMTPTGAAKLRIVDPACGSGSFLIGVYQYLLDWHRDWYVEDDAQKHARGRSPKLYRSAAGDWRLTTAEKKRILLNNIYGVDIDAQAVEVTKLSLLLKVLEGESQETISNQLRLFHERALPDLSSNIKCGNSLISPDFDEDKQLSRLDEEERHRINAFDWKVEFREVFTGRNPGFDTVIGNPPYLKEYTYRQPFEDLRRVAIRKYYQGKMDLWYVFACQAIDILRDGGLHSFIATNNWITNSGASILREKILRETQMHRFVDFGAFRVFRAAGIQTMIYVVEKTGTAHTGRIEYRRLARPRAGASGVRDFLWGEPSRDLGVSCSAVIDGGTSGKPIAFLDDQEARLLARMQEMGTYRLHPASVSTGIDVHQDFVGDKHLRLLRGADVSVGDGIFVISDREKQSLGLAAEEKRIVKPYYSTRELSRFYADAKNRYWVIYTDSGAVRRIRDYPNIKGHLEKFAPVITSDNAPYGLHRAREEQFFVGEKIVSLRKTKRPHFSYTDFPCYVSQTFFVIKPSDINLKYLVAILNSKLCHYWLDKKGKKQGDALQVDKAPLLEIPIRIVDSSHPSDKERHDRLAQLVDRMLSLHKQLALAKTEHDKTVIERQIEATDRQIDRLVYELYGLTDEEIGVVEEATGEKDE